MRINEVMFARCLRNRWLVLGLVCLFGLFALHFAVHHHDDGSSENQCPICHSSVAPALPAIAILVVCLVVVSREDSLDKYFFPHSLVLARTSRRRAPPTA